MLRERSPCGQKPSDAKAIVKGPFKTKADAEKSMKAAGSASKPASRAAEAVSLASLRAAIL